MENYQILSLLEFLGEFTRHLPPKGSHLIRYYGWYSNKGRGMRKESEAGAAHKSSPEIDAQRETPGRCNQTWAMLIKRVYEIDPMVCPKCGDQMKVVAFIEPPQREAIEKILRHSGLWQSSAARTPPDVDELVHELDWVDIDAFRATFQEPAWVASVKNGFLLFSHRLYIVGRAPSVSLSSSSLLYFRFSSWS